MAYYFSVPHLGTGGPDVESLGCYFFRLSHAHGCTQWQLAAHLAVWWDHTHASGIKSRFLKNSSGAKTLAICGFGQGVTKLVQALTLGTGIGTLRSGTLLALQPVAARSSIGTLRNSRAWCPACYEDDIGEGREIYDRLLWAIMPIKRCIHHKITLMDRCPKCDSAQFYSTHSTRLDQCNSCGNSLLSQVDQRAIAERPALGEKLVRDLVAACTINPELTLNRQGMRMFFKRYRCELPMGDPLLSMPSLTSLSMRPTLETIIRMVTAFNVSLLDFQTAQPPLTNRSLYTPASPAVPIRSHCRLPQEVRARVEAALEQALAIPDKPPPFATFCQKLKVSTGYVAYQFPILARAYVARRNKIMHTERTAMLTAAKAAIEAGLMNDYTSGQMTQKKQLIREVARISGVSIVTARKAVALCQTPATKAPHAKQLRNDTNE